MKISIARGITSNGDVVYSVETVKANKIEILGDFDMYDKAIRYAHQYMRDKGEQKDDQIWNWDGTFWIWTGKRWKATHISS